MNINIFGPDSNTGYGVVTRNLVKYFIKYGFDVNFVNISEPEKLIPSLPTIKVWHQYDCSMTGSLKFIYTFFEIDRLTEKDVNELNSNDLIFASCEYAKDIMLQYGVVKPIVVVGCGIDADIFFPQIAEVKSPVKFINVGKWEVRKGHDILYDAFKIASNKIGNDKISLTMMCHNPFLSERQNKKWESWYDNAIHLPRVKTHTELADIYHNHDAGVFVSRAEGWNLELAEMLACGKPCVYTNCTSHKDFAYGYPVEPVGKIDALDGMWFFSQGKWYDFDVNDIANQIVLCYNDIVKGKQFSKDFLWTWDYVMQKFIRVLNSAVKS